MKFLLISLLCAFALVPIYWRLNLAGKHLQLILLSAAAIGWLSPGSLLYVGLIALVSFVAIQRHWVNASRPVFLLLLILPILALCYFKYRLDLLDFLGASEGGMLRASHIAIPLGISYFTFKYVHMIVDARQEVGRRLTVSEHLLYFIFYPIFTAGPIQLSDNFDVGEQDLQTNRDIAYGTRRILFGLMKKLFIVETLLASPYFNTLRSGHAFEYLGQYSQLSGWLYLLVTYLIIYFDFSGYTDIAIGTGRLFGVRVMENFNFPLISRSIRDFWQRWHISLSQWVARYIYMPLFGYSRNPIMALYCAFFVIGIWHELSMSRFLWGMLHGTLILIHAVWKRYTRKIKSFRSDGFGFASMCLVQFCLIISMLFLLPYHTAPTAHDYLRYMALLFGI
ncbi:MAG: MBOAT family protein, partial [Calditrichaeota bacterium]|nr:MBOAT family protein [Calditrichota bacterium]